MIHWMTTAPNPARVNVRHPDAGQRGWKLHAIEARADATLGEVKEQRALCGLRAKYGWGIDDSIMSICITCEKKVSSEQRTP
jgi:hypothetical protein